MSEEKKRVNFIDNDVQLFPVKTTPAHCTNKQSE